MIIKKRNFKDYPSPIGHMILWGLSSGTILGALLNFWIGNSTTTVPTDILSRLLLLLYSLIMGFMFGGISGIILGFFSGFTLARVMRNILAPFTWEDMQDYRLKVYTSVALVTTILASIPIMLLILLTFWAATNSEMVVIPSQFYAVGLAPFIAGIASAYAAHRYMFRLRLWSEHINQKEKAKNFEHLEDKAQLDEIDFDDETESRKHETS